MSSHKKSSRRVAPVAASTLMAAPAPSASLDESALARELLGTLAKVEAPAVRQQAFRAAIMVVEGWGLRSVNVRDDMSVGRKRSVDESYRKKRRREEETLSNRIATDLDIEETDRVLEQLRPIFVKGAIEPSALLVDYFKVGPEAFASSAASDKDLARTICTSSAGDDCQVGDLGTLGGVAKCDDRSELWSRLDKAGGCLERRKAISGLPEFAVELCGGYADAQQYLLVEPGAKLYKPTISHMASAKVLVVFFGGFKCTIWRPTEANVVAVADLATGADANLQGRCYEYDVEAGDAIVVPPGYPHAFDHKPQGVVAWGLRFVAPSSRAIIRALKTKYELDEATRAVYAHHLLKIIHPPPTFDPSNVIPKHTDATFDELEEKARKARRARFRAKKRKIVHSNEAYFPDIFFGAVDAEDHDVQDENLRDDAVVQSSDPVSPPGGDCIHDGGQDDSAAS